MGAMLGGEIFFLPAVAAQMKKQAYGNWKTMLYESLVRASVVRYMAAVEEVGRAAD